MAGILPNEGETLVANMIFKNADVDRGTDLELLLFTDSSIDETITAATIGEPTGTGYARITLSDASWTVTNDVATYAEQTFTATADDWEAVYGYAIVTTGTTPRIVSIELDPAGVYTLTTDDTYNITPSITLS